MGLNVTSGPTGVAITTATGTAVVDWGDVAALLADINREQQQRGVNEHLARHRRIDTDDTDRTT